MSTHLFPPSSLTVTASQPGPADNGLPLSISSATDEPGLFSSPSFTGGSGAFSGGSDSTIYSYTIPYPGTSTTGYAPNGNLLSYNDRINGVAEAWNFTANGVGCYDPLNRLTCADATSGGWAGVGLSWTYDSFGNRKGQTVTVSGSPNTPVPQTETAKYDTNNNHVTFATTAMAGFVYDNSGNVTNDGINTYVYDAEGRLCAMLNGTTKLKTGYAYDGLGNRIAKGAISSSSLTCDSSVFTPTTNFVVGLNGEQLDELDGQGKAQHYNVYANGQLLATYVYAQSEWVYAFNDWLGTKRVTTDAARSATGTCLSLPFGDALNCSGGIDPSEHHFTGKERDSETGFASGNDYFGARYYGSSMGRFMSPDPSQLFYADPTNPQSLNLYSYGRNNPLTNIDPTGLDCVHVNNDTGAYEGFESGDCDNSTAEKANSGYYVDGTINQISFNNQNQVIGYSGSTGDGTFNSFAGSTSMDVGSSAFGVNPYTGSLSTGQSVIVNANGSPTPNPTSINVSNLVDRAQLQNFRPGVHYIGPYTPPSPPNVTGDPSCFGAPDAVSAIHSLQRGVNQNPPSGSSDGQFGKSIYQRTTQGDRPFGNAAADTGFNAAFLGLDYAVAVGNCLQGH